MVRAAAYEEDREIVEIVHWHESQMLRLGLSKQDATMLAFDGVDWHEVEDLVRRQCPPGLIVKILS